MRILVKPLPRSWDNASPYTKPGMTHLLWLHDEVMESRKRVEPLGEVRKERAFLLREAICLSDLTHDHSRLGLLRIASGPPGSGDALASIQRLAAIKEIMEMWGKDNIIAMEKALSEAEGSLVAELSRLEVLRREKGCRCCNEGVLYCQSL